MSSRVIQFSDGFTSATAPSGTNGVIEPYTIANNASSTTLATYDNADFKTVISTYELIRSTSLGTFKQEGSMTFTYVSGAWSTNYGNYSGNEMIVDSLVNDEHITLSFSGNDLQYTSGNMSGTGYTGTLKLSSTRFE
jgi:hypothetical protein